MLKVFSKNKLNIIIFIFLFLFSFYIINPKLVNDTFYDIKIGELILENGIDFKDHFSFINLPYTYPHWLFDLIIYLVYNLFSWLGVNLLTVLISTIIFFIVYKKLDKETNLFFFSLLITMWLINFSTTFLTARAQIFSYLFFLLEYLALSKYIHTKKERYLYALPIISLLISNIHCAVLPLFYILFLPYFTSYILQYKLKYKNKYLKYDLSTNNKKVIKNLSIILIISLLSSLINPNGVNAYTYIIKTLTNNTTGIITEHLPTTIITGPQLYILLFLIIIAEKHFKLKYYISDFLILLGFLLMGLISLRHEIFFLIFGFIIFFTPLLNSLKEHSIEKYDDFFKKLFIKTKYIILLIMIVICSIKLNTINDKFIPKDEYPVDAVNYIKENINIKSMRLFNNYDIGSYILYQDILVFIDSRCDLYTKKYNNKIDIFDDYLKIVTTADEELIKKYEFTHALIYKNTDTYKLFAKQYEILYQDDYFVVFALHKGENHE